MHLAKASFKMKFPWVFENLFPDSLSAIKKLRIKKCSMCKIENIESMKANMYNIWNVVESR